MPSTWAQLQSNVSHWNCTLHSKLRLFRISFDLSIISSLKSLNLASRYIRKFREVLHKRHHSSFITTPLERRRLLKEKKKKRTSWTPSSFMVFRNTSGGRRMSLEYYPHSWPLFRETPLIVKKKRFWNATIVHEMPAIVEKRTAERDPSFIVNLPRRLWLSKKKNQNAIQHPWLVWRVGDGENRTLKCQ